MRAIRDRANPLSISWGPDQTPPGTRCKHGWGDCHCCGTSEARDIIHTARTPDKRTLRRQRRKLARG